MATTIMRGKIEIKFGKERHRLVPRDHKGCGDCSILEVCNNIGITQRMSLCDAIVNSVYEDIEDFNTKGQGKFKLITK